MDNQFNPDYTAIYNRPSMRLRRIAFMAKIDDGIYVIEKRRVARAGRKVKSLFYKIQVADGRTGWMGPFIVLPKEMRP